MQAEGHVGVHTHVCLHVARRECLPLYSQPSQSFAPGAAATAGDGKWTMVHNGLVGLELEDQGHSSDGRGSGNNNNNNNDNNGNVDGPAASGQQQGGAAGGSGAGGSGAGVNPSATGGASGAGSSQEISPADEGSGSGPRQHQQMQQGLARPDGQAFGDPYVTLVLADEPGEGLEGRGAEQGAWWQAGRGLWQALARAVRDRGTSEGVQAKAGRPSPEHGDVLDGGAAIGSGPDLEAGPGAGPTAQQAVYDAATAAGSMQGRVQGPAAPAGELTRAAAGRAALVEHEAVVCGDAAAPAAAPGVPPLPVSVPATAEAAWVPDARVSSSALLAEVRLELAPGETHQADSAAHHEHHDGRVMDGEGKPFHRHGETRESSASSLWRAIQLAMHGRDSRARRHTTSSTVASTGSGSGTRTSISKDDHTTRSVVQLSDCGSMLDGYADSMCLVGATRRSTGEATGVVGAAAAAGRVAARTSEDSAPAHGVVSGRGRWQQPALKAAAAAAPVAGAGLAH